MTKEVNQLVVHFPNGSVQVVKPQQGFKGNWQALADAIGEPYYPRGVKVKYELR